jgi:hypothetical protein
MIACVNSPSESQHHAASTPSASVERDAVTWNVLCAWWTGGIALCVGVAYQLRCAHNGCSIA